MKKDAFKALFICAALIMAAMWLFGPFEFIENKPIHQASSYAGETTRHLGHRSVGFGSEKQALELLTLMKQQPGKLEYNISYTTDVDTVVIGCSFDKNVIMRLHQKKNGHGTHERWGGYILERLENAATGGSLNDTPNGKLPGTFASF